MTVVLVVLWVVVAVRGAWADRNDALLAAGFLAKQGWTVVDAKGGFRLKDRPDTRAVILFVTGGYTESPEVLVTISPLGTCTAYFRNHPAYEKR